MNKLIEYIKSAIAEMKKVTWPTKKETQTFGVSLIKPMASVIVLDGIFTVLLMIMSKLVCKELLHQL